MTTQTQPKVAGSIRLVPLGKIKSACWNPENRVAERRLKKLLASIDDIGLIYPVVLDEDMNLVDGHRRAAAVRLMGWDHIPAIVINSELQHAYGSIQANQERLTGNDLIGVYMTNPRALVSAQRRKVERIEEVCGKSALALIYKTGSTPGIFDLAMRVVRYTEGKVEPRPCLSWLIKHGMGATIRHLIQDGIDAGKVARAIAEDRPLKVKMTAD